MTVLRGLPCRVRQPGGPTDHGPSERQGPPLPGTDLPETAGSNVPPNNVLGVGSNSTGSPPGQVPPGQPGLDRVLPAVYRFKYRDWSDLQVHGAAWVRFNTDRKAYGLEFHRISYAAW